MNSMRPPRKPRSPKPPKASGLARDMEKLTNKVLDLEAIVKEHITKTKIG